MANTPNLLLFFLMLLLFNYVGSGCRAVILMTFGDPAKNICWNLNDGITTCPGIYLKLILICGEGCGHIADYELYARDNF